MIGTLSPLSSLLHTFHREIEMRVGDFVWPPVRYGDRLPVRRDLFRQLSASSGMVGRLSTLGLILSQDVVAGFWLWRATFFSGSFGRLGSEFISDFVFIVLRFWVFDSLLLILLWLNACKQISFTSEDLFLIDSVCGFWIWRLCSQSSFLQLMDFRGFWNLRWSSSLSTVC